MQPASRIARPPGSDASPGRLAPSPVRPGELARNRVRSLRRQDDLRQSLQAPGLSASSHPGRRMPDRLAHHAPSADTTSNEAPGSGEPFAAPAVAAASGGFTRNQVA